MSVLLPTSPVLLSCLPDEVRCEESNPADNSEEVEVGEVMLSESTTGQRRSRREEQSGSRRALLTSRAIITGRSNACAERLSVGQVSRLGRCGPLHC